MAIVLLVLLSWSVISELSGRASDASEKRSVAHLPQKQHGFQAILKSALKAAFALLALISLNSSAYAQKVNLQQYRGKVVYLDFWASWCIPCRQSFPFMEEMQNMYGHQGLVILAVNLDRNRKLADTFLQDIGPHNFTVDYDPKGTTPTEYKVNAMPTSVLIGRDGRVRFRHEGFVPRAEQAYESHIEELLSEK
ncbi:MAG: redoxin family protein [Alphaproteobacteria bacterium]|nr:redoxin family protein [Alphaproteobacteria bacterium]MDE2041965.1 redoxin family protein [Alphaproteobacteria bacterium]MDE2340743.1 redoxin family protein [Alphaproteobacteria bacterium]